MTKVNINNIVTIYLSLYKVYINFSLKGIHHSMNKQCHQSIATTSCQSKLIADQKRVSKKIEACLNSLIKLSKMLTLLIPVSSHKIQTQQTGQQCCNRWQILHQLKFHLVAISKWIQQEMSTSRKEQVGEVRLKQMSSVEPKTCRYPQRDRRL